MLNGYFITGTDTNIGKTYSTIKLISHWQALGHKVAAMKPVASGCTLLDGRWLNEDVVALMYATGQNDHKVVNPYCFLPAIAPNIAAQQAGQTIDFEVIFQAYCALAQEYDQILVEGAGGWFTPLTESLCIADLAQRLQLPVVLVVGMRLGCLNHALLTLAAIRSSGLEFAGWVANQCMPEMASYSDNLAYLQKMMPGPLLLELKFLST